MKIITKLFIAGLILIPVLSGAQETRSADPFSVVYREKIEWLDLWIENGDLPDLSPRVLLVGDSITKGYYREVKGKLKKVTVDKLATSKAVCDPAFLDELRLVLSQYQYDVIHFNNGLHGWDYSEKQFEKGLESFVSLIDEAAPEADLVWATITPCRGSWRDRNPRIELRNKIAGKVLRKRTAAVSDLYKVVEGKAKYYSEDGVHFEKRGIRAQAAEVAKVLKKLLRKRK